MAAGANPTAPVAAGEAPVRPARPTGRRAVQLDELRDAFRRMFRAVNRLRGRDTHLAGTELSHAQFQLLLELEERGEAAVGELAVAAQLAAGTVTRMLDGLAAAGHVQRVPHAGDRRVVLARVTPSGRAQIEAKRAAWQSRWEAALEGVHSAELAAATVVLERLAAMFDEASTGAPARGETGPANSVSTGRKPV